MQSLKELKEAGHPVGVYTASVTIDNNNEFPLSEAQTNRYVDKIQKWCLAVNRLELAEGSQVMLICNYNVVEGYANGTRGIVTKITPQGPEVLFRDGKKLIVGAWDWELNLEEEHVKLIKKQIPLALADATTIHKAQGATIDYLEVDIGKSIFEYGQSYTALSRARTLDGLFITRIEYRLIKTHPKVKNFYKSVH